MQKSEIDKLTVNSLICEMSALKGVNVCDTEVDYETGLIPFICSDAEVVRFLAGLGFDLIREYKKAAFMEISVLPEKDKYLLKTTLLKYANPDKVIMSMASAIDAAAADAPQFYKVG